MRLLEDFSGQLSSRFKATRISTRVNDDKLIKPEMSALLNLIIKVYVFHSNFPPTVAECVAFAINSLT